MSGDRRAALAAFGKAKAGDSGPKLAELHPLERPVYEKFVNDLEKNTVQ
jgi:hypothetical protein